MFDSIQSFIQPFIQSNLDALMFLFISVLSILIIFSAFFIFSKIKNSQNNKTRIEHQNNNPTNNHQNNQQNKKINYQANHQLNNKTTNKAAKKAHRKSKRNHLIQG